MCQFCNVYGIFFIFSYRVVTRVGLNLELESAHELLMNLNSTFVVNEF